jgi:hypothetical protein
MTSSGRAAQALSSAVKARSQAIITLKTIIVTAPAELREQLQPLGDRDLIAACRQLRYDTMSAPADAARYSLRALAERYHTLDTEARLRDRVLATLTDRAAPALPPACSASPPTPPLSCC